MAETTLLEIPDGLGEAQLAQKFIDYQLWLGHERRLSAKTVDSYGRDILFFLQFLTRYKGQIPRIMLFESLDSNDFRAWMADMHQRGLKATSRGRALSALRNFFAWLEDFHNMTPNKALMTMKRPKQPKTAPRPLSREGIDEIFKMLEENNRNKVDWVVKRDVALITLLYGGGLRIGEALALNRRDWADGVESGLLHIMGKGGKGRYIPVLPIVCDHIEDYLAFQPFSGEKNVALFRGVRGKRLQARYVQKLLETVRHQAGLADTATPHALRHSFATHLLSEGGHLRAVQELLGHKSISATQRYTEVDLIMLQDQHKKAHPRARLLEKKSSNDEPLE